MSLNRNQFIQALSMASLTMWLSKPNDSEQATLDTKPPIKPKALKKNSKIDQGHCLLYLCVNV